jgi:hypothetical protein
MMKASINIFQFFIIMVFSLILLSCNTITSPIDEDTPTALKIQKLSNFSIRLSWEYEITSEDTIYYQIARKSGTGSWTEDIVTLASDIYHFTDYIPTTDSVAYAYKVRYYNYSLDLVSPYSETIAFLSENTNPINMKISQLTQENLEITWKDRCIGEQGYIIDKRINDGSWEEGYLLLEPDAERFTDTTALFDSVSYRLCAYIGVSKTEYLSQSHFSTLLAPSDLECSIPDLNKIRLNWQDNSTGEAGFYIDKKIGELDWQISYASVPENITTFVDDNLLPCGTLNYRIRAYSNSYFSGYSDLASLNINLEILCSYPTPGNALEVFLPVDNIYIPQWTAFISDSYEGLAILDCHNPAGPTEIVTYSDLWGDRTLSSFAQGNFVYVATQSLANAVGGIQKVDVSTFDNPIISHVTPTSGIPKSLYVEGDYAYLAEGDSGLSIMYIASSIPDFISNIDLNDARSIVVRQISNSVYALIADGLNSGLAVIDVSLPDDPIQIGSLPLPGLAIDVHFSNDFACLANGEEGLEIIDVTNMNNPQSITTIHTGGFVNSVFAVGNYIYITDYEKGLFVIDASVPLDSYILGYLYMDTQPVSIHVSGSYAYITDNQGLKIVKIKP